MRQVSTMQHLEIPCKFSVRKQPTPEQFYPEGLQPIEKIHAAAVHELQPVKGTPTGAVHEGLYSIARTPMLENGKSMRRKAQQKSCYVLFATPILHWRQE